MVSPDIFQQFGFPSVSRSAGISLELQMLCPWTEKLKFFTVRYQDFVSKICHESVWLAFKQEIKQKKTHWKEKIRVLRIWKGNSPIDIHLEILWSGLLHTSQNCWFVKKNIGIEFEVGRFFFRRIVTKKKRQKNRIVWRSKKFIYPFRGHFFIFRRSFCFFFCPKQTSFRFSEVFCSKIYLRPEN